LQSPDPGNSGPLTKETIGNGNLARLQSATEVQAMKGVTVAAESVAGDYEAPALTVLGSLSDLTMGGGGIIAGDVLLSVASIVTVGIHASVG
jgi:hypothetical protein